MHNITFSRLLLVAACLGVALLARAQDTLAYYDFDGDLQGWTTTDLTGSGDVWVFSTTGPSGAFAIAPIESTTAANGYALYDSDLLCSGSQNSRLVSPMFDFTNETEGEVRYQERYRRFQDRVYLGVSTDGGVTYTETDLYPALAANDFNDDNPFIGRVDVSSVVAGQDSVVFAFRYEGGCDYAWMLDDIAISNMATPRPNTDLVVQDNFFAISPNFATPARFAEGQVLVFLADILNNGALAQNNVQLGIQIFDESNTLIYTDSLDYGTIASDSLAENKAFPNTFPLPTEVGIYRGVYTIVSDSTDNDGVPNDNSLEYTFAITEDYYAKGATFTTAVQPGSGAEAFEAGNIYYTPGLDDEGGVVIDSIELGFFLDGLTDDGTETILEVNTYGYRGDLNGDGIPQEGDLDDDEAEMVGLGFFEYEFNDMTSPEGFLADIVPASLDDGSITVPAGEDFIGFAIGISYVESSSPGTTPNQFFIGIDGNREIGAYNLAVDTLGVEEAFTSYLFPGSDDGAFNFANGSIWVNAILGTIIDVEDELPSNAVSVRPNPANEQLLIDLNLVDAQVQTVVVRNAVGQEVYRAAGLTASGNTLEVPTRRFNEGLYFLELTTDSKQVATRRFMVAH